MEIAGSLLAILAGLAIAVLLNLASGRKKTNHEMVAETAEISDLGDFPTQDDTRVRDILKDAYIDLKRQRAVAHGPWLASLLEGDLYVSGHGNRGRVFVDADVMDIEPSVALTAIQWTIRDILSVPISYDKDGMEMPHRMFNLDKLHQAENELMEMMGEGE